MTEQSDQQPQKAASPKKRYGILFLEYILRVCLPAAAVVLLANLLLGYLTHDEPREAIQKAYWAGNYTRARNLCKQQMDTDFFDLDCHRTYLYCCKHINSLGDREEDLANLHAQTEQEYQNYTQNSDPNIADIGYYGLGFYYSIRKKYPDALATFEHVGNKKLKYLNNSIGHAYFESGNNPKAQEYFLLEIESKGNLAGAYGNLSRLYYKQKDFAALNRLVSDEHIRPYIPERICRYVDLKNRRLGSYFVNTISIDYLTWPGIAAAVFVLWIWFNYLRKLDVFEPEKPGWLVRALILGMAFSMLCGFLYDIADFALGLKLGGGVLNDLIYCIFGIGLIEEAVKIIPFLLVLKFSRQVNESIDYIIYAAVCALGFAFMENLIYFQDPGLVSITGRTLWAVTAHMTWSATAAYGLFYARYKKENQHTMLFFLFAFTAACILHGLYDFFLMAEGLPPQTKTFSLYILLISIVVFSKMIRNALNHSEFNSEKQKKIEGLSKHLVYALSGVVLLQYLLVGWKLGVQNANFQILRGILFSYLPLIVIFSSLGIINVQQGVWVPLFERKKRKRQENAEKTE